MSNLLDNNAEIILNNQNLNLSYILKNKIHTFCSFPDNQIPNQGWKIHISCFFDNYKEILDLVSNYCIKNRIDFKFINKKITLYKLLSKNSDRISSGKFITIYPITSGEFKVVINDLYILLQNFQGPYILTDQRFKDCKILYYRYGLFVPNGIDPGYLYDSEGNKYLDIEGPFYTPRRFIEDPFPIAKDVDNAQESKIAEDYSIHKALQMNNGGGIYKGERRKDRVAVVIKEARPYIGINQEYTSIFFRKREKDNLLKLKNCQYVPQVIEYFKEWEHEFLVEEYIEGITLQEFISNYSLVTLSSNDQHNIEEYSSQIEKVVLNLIKALKYFHSINFIINDISPNNIIVSKDYRITFVDLEDSYFLDENPLKYIVHNNIFSTSNINNLSPKDQDKQKLGYLFISIFCSANETLKFDSSGFMCQCIFSHFFERYNLNNMVKEKVLDLVNFPQKTDLESLLEVLSSQKWISRENKPISNSFIPPEEILSHVSFSSEVNFLKKSICESGLTIAEYYLFKECSPIENCLDEWESTKNNYLNSISNGTDVSLSLESGELSKLRDLLFIYSISKDFRILTHIRDLIVLIDKQAHPTPTGRLLPNSSFTLSPYINYSAGFVKLCILFIKVHYDEEIVLLVKEYLKALDNDFPRNPSYAYGLSGIADTFLDAYDLFGEDKYLQASIRKYNVLLLFMKKAENHQLSFPSRQLEQTSNDFKEGTLGILYYILHLSRIL